MEDRRKILEVEHLSKRFRSRRKQVDAVSDLSFFIYEGEAFGVIGESGSGKSTTASLIAGFYPPDQGQIKLLGTCLTGKTQKENSWEARKHLQMVFQNPQTSFQPNMKIRDALMEGLRYYTSMSRQEMEQRAVEVLEEVGLDASYGDRYPSELSGGECQRAAIGRAIMIKPSFLICDEITSALDVSVQAQIMELLKTLQKDLNMAILFISHDLALVSNFCSRVIVMQNGKVVEAGDTTQVITHPKSSYTKTLLDAVLEI